MKKYLSITILSFLLVACETTSPINYSGNPLDLSPQHQLIYKVNITDQLYWELVMSDGTKVLTLDNPILINTPDNWKQELIDNAYKLYKNKVGE